jgi:hypothetical protein
MGRFRKTRPPPSSPSRHLASAARSKNSSAPR